MGSFEDQISQGQFSAYQVNVQGLDLKMNVHLSFVSIS